VLGIGDPYDLVVDLPAYLSLASILTLILLAALYASQRRDLRRLYAWMEQDPDHPASDMAASEVLLDRAEAELEAIFGDGGAEPEPASATAVAPAPPEAAARPPTAERPALERLTAEREALQPHPGRRRLATWVSQP